MRQITISIILSFFICTQLANAQIQAGRITDKEKQAVPYATINLIDSINKVIDYAISDPSGEFILTKHSKNGYKLTVSAIGYESYVQEVDSSSFNKSLDITLKESDNVLQEVSITAKKPVIEAKIGKLIYNLENTPLIQTSSAVDVLGKAPGVMVDVQNESINLNGKKVLILVDGKKTYLEGAQVYQYLNNIQAGTLDKIELINNPSAKYDAGAVINIITKKDKTHGWNASLASTTGHGKQPEAKGNAFFNYRSKPLAITASLGGNYDKSPTTGNLVQKAIDYNLSQEFNSLSRNDGFYGRLSLDFFVNQKNTLGLAYSRNQYGKESSSISQSDRQSDGDALKSFYDNNIGDNNSARDLYSFNYTSAFTEHRKLSINADYSRSNTSGINQYSTDFNNELYRRRLNDLSLGNNLFSATLDYEDLWKEKYQIEVGAKLSDVRTNNINTFNTTNVEESQMAALQNDHYIYREHVYAGYINIQTQFNEKMGMQLGLRGEYTKTNGNSVSMGIINKKDYYDLFPSITLSYQAHENHSLSLAYNKSIERPSFRSLNPFRYYSDIYSASEGNPYLKPAYNHEVALQYMLKSKYAFTLGYQQVNGENQEYYMQDTDGETLISKYENYGKTAGFVLAAYVPIDFTKWWTTRVQLQVMHISVEKEGFSKSGPGIGFNTASTFKLPKAYYLELTNNYTYASAMGIYKIDPVYSINFAASKSFVGQRLSVKAQAIDLFSLYRWRASTTQNNIFYAGGSKGRGAMYMLSLTYKLGKSTVKGSNAKSKSIGAEQSRLNETNVENQVR